MEHRHILHLLFMHGLTTIFLVNGLGNQEPTEWPLGSPDLIASDSFLWGWAKWVKQEVYQSKLRIQNELEQQIRDTWTLFLINFLIQTVVESVSSRLQKCVQNDWAYIKI
jgi:hypothetical protein